VLEVHATIGVVGSSAWFGPAVPPTPDLLGPDWPQGTSSGETPQDTRMAPPPLHAGDALAEA
jgi:hypothetical protein